MVCRSSTGACGRIVVDPVCSQACGAHGRQFPIMILVVPILGAFPGPQSGAFRQTPNEKVLQQFP